MEQIEVEARYDRQGQVHPRRIFLGGEPYEIDSIGRRWEDNYGEHILVMLPGGKVFELVYNPAERCWYLGESRGKRTLA